MSSIALTGGGTAGHIMPNLALLPELCKYFEKIIYIGGDGMERDLVPKYGIKFFSTSVVKLNRSNLLQNAKIPFVLNKGIKEAKNILQSAHIDVVFSKGGYAALPACFAAKSLKIPVVTHESDYTMGMANKLISMFAASTLTGFAETKGGTFVGNPLREEILKGNAAHAVEKYKLPPRPTVLVFGGSLGAEAINHALEGCLSALLKEYNIVHITGKNAKKGDSGQGYTRLEFANDIADLYAVADLVVIRGGANSLAEAAALGKRTLCIPLPKGASRGDQQDNAKSYQKKGLLEILEQNKLTPDSLYLSIQKLIVLPEPAPVYRNTNAVIVKEILKVL
ncbi:MAG: UDP-N-acetylglucosamine--N-acetylmuramyl-(pentapeptide) pyrophosphoryl-undecaprenol N-acetylglucosamine transferase [Clostridia bacterium]|nr:UDP-N-acetylglucosamine--N-acetylmuramyl-(pentapeptide) pyrophosphoryl-undecaprenol N-acetylglucosamine transferase [Clostridia bacterium]